MCVYFSYPNHVSGLLWHAQDLVAWTGHDLTRNHVVLSQDGMHREVFRLLCRKIGDLRVFHKTGYEKRNRFRVLNWLTVESSEGVHCWWTEPRNLQCFGIWNFVRWEILNRHIHSLVFFEWISNFSLPQKYSYCSLFSESFTLLFVAWLSNSCTQCVYLTTCVINASMAQLSTPFFSLWWMLMGLRTAICWKLIGSHCAVFYDTFT